MRRLIKMGTKWRAAFSCARKGPLHNRRRTRLSTRLRFGFSVGAKKKPRHGTTKRPERQTRKKREDSQRKLQAQTQNQEKSAQRPFQMGYFETRVWVLTKKYNTIPIATCKTKCAIPGAPPVTLSLHPVRPTGHGTTSRVRGVYSSSMRGSPTCTA